MTPMLFLKLRSDETPQQEVSQPGTGSFSQKILVSQLKNLKFPTAVLQITRPTALLHNPSASSGFASHLSITLSLVSWRKPWHQHELVSDSPNKSTKKGTHECYCLRFLWFSF